jgi:hypothetical protein
LQAFLSLLRSALDASLAGLCLGIWAQKKLKYYLENKIMKILVTMFLAVSVALSAQAEPQSTRGHFQRAETFRPRLGSTHFIARSGNGFHPHFHYGNGGVVVFDPLDYASDYNSSGDDTVYQGQIAPQDAASLPYATPTSDPNMVISPYEPHATISVAGIPHGAQVQDPVSNLIFLNP